MSEVVHNRRDYYVYKAKQAFEKAMVEHIERRKKMDRLIVEYELLYQNACESKEPTPDEISEAFARIG